jgi:NAD(P)-dependent dehydrogenase (short-subunit alcohol dehydrogenase family)
MHLYDRTFLVSGGSSGLGAACVRMLAGAGGNAVIADLNREAGEKLATDLGRRVRFIHTDITDEASVQNAVAAAVQTFGHLHGAVSCAGIALAERVLGKTGSHDLAAFTRVIRVNLIGTFNVTRLAAAAIANAPAGPDGERGVIINTASVAAFEGQVGQAAYSASKGGIVAMTLPIARELAHLGIRVLAIAPGIFDTPLLAGLPEPARQSLGQQVPFPPRLGRPEEFAALVRHLVENVMLNGTVVRLDGALRMAPR